MRPLIHFLLSSMMYTILDDSGRPGLIELYTSASAPPGKFTSHPQIVHLFTVRRGEKSDRMNSMIDAASEKLGAIDRKVTFYPADFLHSS